LTEALSAPQWLDAEHESGSSGQADNDVWMPENSMTALILRRAMTGRLNWSGLGASSLKL
jgi:hypothetical protein